MRYRSSGQNAHRIAGFVLAVLLAAAGPATAGTNARPGRWAQPVASTVLPNWFQVDEGLYRSRQPDRKGFEEASRKGIRTVINLRADRSDAELVAGLGLNLVEIPMYAGAFTDDQVLSALKAIQESPKPVLIHCQHGADRAGVVSAAYRVLFHGWSKEEAVAELKNGGFGFHRFYANIPRFIRTMNLDKFRARLSLPKPLTQAPAERTSLP